MPSAYPPIALTNTIFQKTGITGISSKRLTNATSWRDTPLGPNGAIYPIELRLLPALDLCEPKNKQAKIWNILESFQIYSAA